MGKRISRSFFKTDKLIFVGYSKKNEAFCAGIADAYAKQGTTVFPVNPEPAKFSRKVYEHISAVPEAAELAYVLTSKKHNLPLVDALAERGVKRVIFQSSMSADAAVLAHCAEKGLEAVVACPMMALGGGFHRFHGFLAGVRK